MKRTLIFILFFFTFLPILSFGQILIGMKGGYHFSVPLQNSSEKSYSDADLWITQNSYLISGFIKSRIQNKIFNWGAEVEYYKTGLSGHQTSGGLGAGTIYNYNFLLNNLNLILKPEFVFGSRWKFIINTGAYVGILLNVRNTGDWKTYGPPPITTGELDETKNHYFNTLNFGFLGGFGTEFPISNPIIINLEANCTIGITNLAKPLSSVFFNLLDLKLSTGLAYKINCTSKGDKEK